MKLIVAFLRRFQREQGGRFAAGGQAVGRYRTGGGRISDVVFSRRSELFGQCRAVWARRVIEVDLRLCFRIMTLQRERYTLPSAQPHPTTNATIKMGYLCPSHFFIRDTVCHLVPALNALVHFFSSLSSTSSPASDRCPPTGIHCWRLKAWSHL